MKPLKGYKDAVASEGFEKLAPGGYVIKITEIEDDAKKEYLRVTYDIAEGTEAGRYKNETPDNAYRHQFIRSYKDTALGMFKAFIKAVDESNGTKFDADVEGKGINEQLLVGKLLGVVIGYEEYEANDGNVKERQRIALCCSTDRIRRQDVKVPELKKLPASKKGSPVDGFSPLSVDDLPF